MAVLSVIIPFRCENKKADYLIKRLIELMNVLPKNTSEIECILVDSGSSQEYSKYCQQLCLSNDVRYLYHDSVGKTFSLSDCRDFGVQHAHGKAITFLDVDLRMAPSFWSELLTLMKVWGISEYKTKFLAVPCLYLSEEGTQQFNELEESEYKYKQFYCDYLLGKKDNIESFANCSSVMVVDRFHYLTIGGHNPDFSGHGYEDFELYHRLMVEDDKLPRASNYTVDTKSWTTFTYNGFRSQLSICARPALMMGLMVFHMWHPRPKSSTFYNTAKMKENRERIIKAFEKFDTEKKHPKPLLSLNSKIKPSNTLYFSPYNSNSYNCLRDFIPVLGDVICASEYDFFDLEKQQIRDSFKDFLVLNNIKKIIFPNPYGNEVRLKFYKWCQSNNFPYFCFDRGALPDSWFLDPNGFNADSVSYLNIDYETKLSLEKQEEVTNYINYSLYDAIPLESQGNRIGKNALLNKLNIHDKKVLFVPLQRPSDTVIKYFSGDIENYTNFIELIDTLAAKLKAYGWVTLVKKHPLESVTPQFNNVTIVPEDTHFLDLIDVCDATALINSGVGVYAMMAQKPCFIFGDSFYNVPDVNYTVKKEDYSNEYTLNNLVKKIVYGQTFNEANMLKFVDFLISDFYSFGKPMMSLRKEKDGSFRNMTTKINFYELRVEGNLFAKYIVDDTPQISKNAPLFERYGLDFHLKKSVSVAKPTSVVKKSVSVPVPKSAPAVSSSNSPLTRIEDALEQKVRQLNKLKRSPYEFFNDSKNKKLKKMRVLFEK